MARSSPSSGSCRPTATSRTVSPAGCATGSSDDGDAEARAPAARSTRPPGVRAARQRRPHRAGLPPRRLRDPERPLPRASPAAAGVDLARRALARAGLAPAEVGLDRQRLLHRLHDPGRRRLRGRRARAWGRAWCACPSPRAAAPAASSGLARARDYLAAHPDRAALVLALEFASLTFQRWDRSATNVVSTAIFGDGGAAVVLVGADHPRAPARRAGAGPRTRRACSSPAPRTSWASTCATRACRSSWTASSRPFVRRAGGRRGRRAS